MVSDAAATKAPIAKIAVTVGWWVFLTLTVSVVFGNVAAVVFAVCSALSVTVGYGLVRASDSRE